MSTNRETDLRMLSVVLRFGAEHEADDYQVVSGQAFRAFGEMAVRLESRPGTALSDKQRKWLAGVYERVTGEPQYENLVSSGRVPRGREVETPAVLQNLPKRPPGRRVEP